MSPSKNTQPRKTQPHKTVTVNLGHRSYDILIGENLLSKGGELIATHLNAPRLAIVTDETVYNLHGETLETALSDYKTHIILYHLAKVRKALKACRLYSNISLKPNLTVMILS